MSKWIPAILGVANFILCIYWYVEELEQAGSYWDDKEVAAFWTITALIISGWFYFISFINCQHKDNLFTMLSLMIKVKINKLKKELEEK